MSEMFTKCNGFIVSGDPLVYADSATMTGQGTVSEPFGVKSTDLFVQEPLYTGTSGNSAYIGWNNETLLWSGEPSASNVGITLSEPMSGFEKVDIYWKSYERRFVNEMFATGIHPIAVGAVFVNSDGNYEKSMTHWASTDGTNFTWRATIHGSFTGNQTSTFNTAVIPLKIVGINRKA